MIIAKLPFDEESRLNELASFDIMDTPPENDFDELVEMACLVCNCPVSLITLLDKDRQWFKAKKGFTQVSTSRDVAFCSHAILQDGVMTVEDAAADPRFFDNPLVTGDANIRFYAGAPITSEHGNNMGTICVIDIQPKTLSKNEEKALTILSNQVAKLLELRKKNELIRLRAVETIALKTQSMNWAIQEHEEEKKDIAYNLSEDVAQRLASLILYLQLAEREEVERLNLLQTATKHLQNLLVDTQNLSYAIRPTTVDWIPVEELIGEFVEKISSTFHFDIQYEILEKTEHGNAEVALVAIRIIELWLKILSYHKGVSSVKIKIKSKEQFELFVEHNNQLPDLKQMEEEVFKSSIYERVHLKGGTIDLKTTSKGNNLLSICWPHNDDTVKS